MADQLWRFPRGQVSIGGDLHQATDATIRIANNATAKHTLRSEGDVVGVVKGVEDTSGSITCIIPADGMERAWVTDYVRKMKGANIKYKAATSTFTVEAVITSADFTFPNADAIQLSIGWVGKFID